MPRPHNSCPAKQWRQQCFQLRKCRSPRCCSPSTSLSRRRGAVNVNDCVTKSKFDNVCVCRHICANNVVIGGRRALVCGFAAMWAMVALLLSVVVMLVCSKPNVTPSAVFPKIVKPDSVSKPVVTSNTLACGRDKCAPDFRREDEDSMFYSREVLVRAGPLDGANPFGASLNGELFVDDEPGDWVLVQVASEAWGSVHWRWKSVPRVARRMADRCWISLSVDGPNAAVSVVPKGTTVQVPVAVESARVKTGRLRMARGRPRMAQPVHVPAVGAHWDHTSPSVKENRKRPGAVCKCWAWRCRHKLAVQALRKRERESWGTSASVRQQCGGLSVGQRRQVPAVQTSRKPWRLHVRSSWIWSFTCPFSLHWQVPVFQTVQKHVEVQQLQSINEASTSLSWRRGAVLGWSRSLAHCSLQQQMPIVQTVQKTVKFPFVLRRAGWVGSTGASCCYRSEISLRSPKIQTLRSAQTSECLDTALVRCWTLREIVEEIAESAHPNVRLGTRLGSFCAPIVQKVQKTVEVPKLQFIDKASESLGNVSSPPHRGARGACTHGHFCMCGTCSRCRLAPTLTMVASTVGGREKITRWQWWCQMECATTLRTPNVVIGQCSHSSAMEDVDHDAQDGPWSSRCGWPTMAQGLPWPFIPHFSTKDERARLGTVGGHARIRAPFGGGRQAHVGDSVGDIGGVGAVLFGSFAEFISCTRRWLKNSWKAWKYPGVWVSWLILRTVISSVENGAA